MARVTGMLPRRNRRLSVLPRATSSPSGHGRPIAWWSVGAFLVLVHLASACKGSELLSAGCGTSGQRPVDQRGRATITSGVVGNVWEWVGQFPTCGVMTPVAALAAPAAQAEGLQGFQETPVARPARRRERHRLGDADRRAVARPAAALSAASDMSSPLPVVGPVGGVTTRARSDGPRTGRRWSNGNGGSDRGLWSYLTMVSRGFTVALIHQYEEVLV